MGYLPYVYDMPVRFTQADNKEQGVFKNSRGKFQGIILHDIQPSRKLTPQNFPKVTSIAMQFCSEAKIAFS